MVIFGRDSDACTETKAIFAALQMKLVKPVVYILIDSEEILFKAYMLELTGADVFPRVFIGGNCVGGNDEITGADLKGKSGTSCRTSDVM